METREMKTNIVKLKSQQGDVMIRKLSAMPAGEQRVVARKRCILAHGESGNLHLVEQDDAELIQIGEKMLLKVESNAKLSHGEHHAHTLSPGIWEIGIVREKDWFTEMVRNVID